MRSSSSPASKPSRGLRFKFKSKPEDPVNHGDVPSSRSASPSLSPGITPGRYAHHHRSRKREEDPLREGQHKHKHHRSHHRHHHRKHRRLSSSPGRSASPARTPPVSPNTAFRESLFDALADDEGAAYWEGVYGQPIHTYSRYKAAKSSDNNGEASSEQPLVLELMTDDEYAAYVRARMWEKSHAHILEERARREEARAEARAERKAEEQSRRKYRAGVYEASGGEQQQRRGRAAWDADLHGAMKRGEARRDNEVWARRWREYLREWEDLSKKHAGVGQQQEINDKTDAEKDGDDKLAANTRLEQEWGRRRRRPKLPWPVPSRRQEDISKPAVCEFFRRCAEASAASAPSTSNDKSSSTTTAAATAATLLATLKTERVRWHPDKIQQRFGAGAAEETEPDFCTGGGGGGWKGISESEMKAVTAVFQIVDALFGEVQREVQQA